ncbi:helix-turn-helix domain-containing protein [Nocardiopsis sp. HUAS JQ3]|uniref:helix-turn-helix domain-containing protein n=1 Tax=Nocardiopsis sp. HUAS JQ3 TaxID=3061629 RepID=UPI0023A932B2|nr:helix-turn-helix transcriptional regulator [Nocardiopsis sp. HUAS JQ3]WDZ91174.1 helix-turn-helix transcriptional regulator [Nocardiopsis sp. HUAS JQ3]
MINASAVVALRTALGYSRVQVARAAGISPQYYGEIERGKRGRRPAPRVRNGIADALGVPAAAITYRQEAA